MAGGAEDTGKRSDARENVQDSQNGQAAPPNSETVAYNNAFLSNEEAAQIGHRLNADIVIVGTAKTKIVPNTMGATIKSFQGIADIRAVDVDSGHEIAAINRESVTVNSDEIAGGVDALSAAGNLAGKELSSQIVISWKKSSGQTGKVQIVIKGTSDLGSYVRLRRTLGEIPGVAGLQIQEMKPDEATLLVDYNGGSGSLAESLMRKTFENFGINIFELDNDRLRLEIISNRKGNEGFQ
jgi:hypothetical protein